MTWSAANYNGFYLSVDTMVLLENFELVETEYQPSGDDAVNGTRC